jgi:hypothetical protein
MLWENALGKCFGKMLWQNALAKCFGKMLWQNALAKCFGKMLWQNVWQKSKFSKTFEKVKLDKYLTKRSVWQNFLQTIL